MNVQAQLKFELAVLYFKRYATGTLSAVLLPFLGPIYYQFPIYYFVVVEFFLPPSIPYFRFYAAIFLLKWK